MWILHPPYSFVVVTGTDDPGAAPAVLGPARQHAAHHRFGAAPQSLHHLPAARRDEAIIRTAWHQLRRLS